VAYSAGDIKVLRFDGTNWEEKKLADYVELTQSKSFVISNPTANSDLPLWRVPYAITITAIHVLTPVGTITGNLWEFDSNGLNGSTVDADITTIEGVNTNDDGSLSNPDIAANNYIGWKTAGVTGTPTYAIISFEYTID